MIINYNQFILESENKWTINDPEAFNIQNYEWVNGKLNCFQDVYINGMGLLKLPFEFGIVTGDFVCNGNNFTSLFGCPERVEGNIGCGNNKLENLEFCPKYVGKDFYCGQQWISCIEDYPRCIINGGQIYVDKNPKETRVDIHLYYFQDICVLVKENMDKFIPLLDNKIAFHQMVMRLNPSLIKFYHNITPPTKKTLL